MRALILLIFLGSTCFEINAQVYKTVYVDFGPNDLANGNPTSSPDANGSYWNNVTDPNSTATPVNLIDSRNQTTGANLVISSSLMKNGIQNGGLLNPSAQLLKHFAIASATQDYFHTGTSGSITIRGLNKSRGYVFSIFATRNDPETRITNYTATGATSYTATLKTSGSNIGGAGYNGNNNTIVVMPTVSPNSSGEIVITLSKIAGAFAYLGILKMEEVDQVHKTFFVDFGPNDVTNGNITASPDANGNFWNNATDPATTAAALLLKDVKNQVTPASLVISKGFLMNGINNGGLLAPSSALLKQFAIPTVTQDYFHTPNSGSIILKGLDKTRGYVFSVFATRNDAENRTSTYTFLGANQYSGTLKTSGTNLGGTGYNGNNSSIVVSKTIMPNSNGEITLVVTKTANSFAYIAALKIEEVNAGSIVPFCNTKDNRKIAWMGSSVAWGLGGTNNQGYVYRYTQQLTNRFNTGTGKNWKVSNISISGNNSIALLNRWNSDLLPTCSRYVVYAVGLGNEGIITGEQGAFDQFRDNIQLLIAKARLEGIEPIITNCYPRNDYTAVEYNYAKQMNALINSWNVSSINLMGASDNGAGKWVPGYFYDGLHPNDNGHSEFMYSIVPSLFDALDAGKPQPQIVNGTALSMGSASSFKLEFTPEEILHPFTFSVDVKTSATGNLCQFETAAGLNSLSINAGGRLQYSSVSSSGVLGSTIVNNNQWHKITLTHYYALGRTLVYVDNVLQGTSAEKMVAKKFTLAGETSPTAEYRNLFLFRSAINAEEVATMVSNKLLKSSLEIYSPLDAQGITGSDTLVNLAQSLNKVRKIKINAQCNGVLSLNKIATATGQCNSSEAPTYAVDGNSATKWCSGNGGDKWLEVNLGQNRQVCNWYVQHAGNESANYITSDFKLQRKEGTSWMDVDAVVNNTSNTHTRAVSPFMAQFVRLYITKPERVNTAGVARIYEFSVFGTTSALRTTGEADINEKLFYGAPNPFTGSATFSLEQKEDGDVSVQVYNKTGELVQTIFEGHVSQGKHEFVLDGSRLSSDVYLVKCTSNEGVIVRKILKIE